MEIDTVNINIIQASVNMHKKFNFNLFILLPSLL